MIQLFFISTSVFSLYMLHAKEICFSSLSYICKNMKEWNIVDMKLWIIHITLSKKKVYRAGSMRIVRRKVVQD